MVPQLVHLTRTDVTHLVSVQRNLSFVFRLGSEKWPQLFELVVFTQQKLEWDTVTKDRWCRCIAWQILCTSLVFLCQKVKSSASEICFLLLGRSQLYPTFNAPQDVSTPFVGYLCAATSAATYQFSQLEPKLIGSPALVCVSGSNRAACQMDLDFMQCKHQFPDESFAAPSIFLDGVFVPADSRCQETDLSADYSLTHPF